MRITIDIGPSYDAQPESALDRALPGILSAIAAYAATKLGGKPPADPQPDPPPPADLRHVLVSRLASLARGALQASGNLTPEQVADLLAEVTDILAAYRGTVDSGVDSSGVRA
jgi:hypothetical protein